MRARLYLRLESGDTPAGRQGLPLLFHRMVDHAETADLKAGELDRVLEDSGIQLTQSLDAGGFTWGLVARSRDQDRAMGLLADRVLRTVFEPALLEVQRLACQRQLERPEGSPRQQLRQALTQDPASRPTLNSLRAITLPDLLAFRSKVVRPDRAILILHGDLGLEQAKRLVLLSLGSWTAQGPPPPGHPPSGSTPAAPPTAAEEALRIPDPGAGMRVQAVAPRPGDLAPEAAELLNLLVTRRPGPLSCAGGGRGWWPAGHAWMAKRALPVHRLVPVPRTAGDIQATRRFAGRSGSCPGPPGPPAAAWIPSIPRPRWIGPWPKPWARGSRGPVDGPFPGRAEHGFAELA